MSANYRDSGERGTRDTKNFCEESYIELMDTSRSHSRFNDERENVLKDIGDFLFMVFGFLKEMTEYGVFIKNDRKLRNLELVIESLCLIHGLYGYPAETSDNPGNVTELLTLGTPTIFTYHDCEIARSVDNYRHYIDH